MLQNKPECLYIDGEWFLQKQFAIDVVSKLAWVFVYEQRKKVFSMGAKQQCHNQTFLSKMLVRNKLECLFIGE
jgi:hypothetical protein